MLLLLVIGTAHDLWRASRSPAVPPFAAAPKGPGPLPTADTAATTAATKAGRDTALLDLNRAEAAELDLLPGIGPVLARRIVEYRREHGSFRRFEELRAVRGVGPRLLSRLRRHVRVVESSTADP